MRGIQTRLGDKEPMVPPDGTSSRPVCTPWSQPSPRDAEHLNVDASEAAPSRGLGTPRLPRAASDSTASQADQPRRGRGQSWPGAELTPLSRRGTREASSPGGSPRLPECPSWLLDGPDRCDPVVNSHALTAGDRHSGSCRSRLFLSVRIRQAGFLRKNENHTHTC